MDSTSAHLPTFVELAETQLRYAAKRDKIITIKITIPTARMMCKAETARRDALRKALEEFLTVDWSTPQDAPQFMQRLAENARKALEDTL